MSSSQAMSLCLLFSSYSHGTWGYVSMSLSQVMSLCLQVRLCPYVFFFHHIHTALEVICLCPYVFKSGYVPMSYFFIIFTWHLRLCVHVLISSYVSKSSSQAMSLCLLFSTHSHNTWGYVSMSLSQIMSLCLQVRLCPYVIFFHHIHMALEVMCSCPYLKLCL